MPNYTPNLNLFKYDTTKDGKEVFSIEKALNENWDKLDKGGSSSGLKIGTIMQGFIDESQNKERYLNGGVIVQDQFVSFTNWIKNIVKLYPSLKVTEDQWQAELKLSAKGQCGKFVIDDAKNVIRLPKVVNIQGLFDLTQSGMLKEAGLPNITGRVFSTNCVNISQNSVNGAFYHKIYSGYCWGATDARKDVKDFGVYMNASRSNPIYGKSNTVQEEAVQYPYYIVVATGSKDSIDVIREAELNNPFTFGMYIYTQSILNNVSWLRSTGQWNTKAVYTDFYNWLLKTQNGSAPVEGVSVKLSTESYTDYDYVLNTTKQTFRLPLKVYQAPTGGEAPVKGNGLALGLTNGKQNYGVVADNNGVSNWQVALKGATEVYGTKGPYKSPNIEHQSVLSITPDGSKSGMIVDLLKATNDKLYLYFYVGETVQNVNLINAGRIEETLVNKADVSGDNVTIIPRTEDYFFAFSIQKGLVQQVPDNMYIRCSATNNNTNDIFIVVDCCNADGSSNFGLFHFNKGGNPSSKCIFWSPLFKKGSYIKVKDIRGGADNINLRGYYVQKHN